MFHLFGKKVYIILYLTVHDLFFLQTPYRWGYVDFIFYQRLFVFLSKTTKPCLLAFSSALDKIVYYDRKMNNTILYIFCL